MDILFSSLSNALSSMFSAAWILFIHGGWIIALIFITYIAYIFYLGEIGAHAHHQLDPVLLQIKVERNNLQSTLAVEQIFAQMHAAYTAISFAERYLEGKHQVTLALEIASIGGKISYFVHCPRKLTGLVESAFYSRYPSAEITEVEDYMQRLGAWNPEASWDVWGTEMKMIKDHAYPLKTYSDFEHAAAEERIIDPTAGLIEALNHADPHELLAVQFCLTPVSDGDWAPTAIAFSKKLKQEFLAGEATAGDEDGKKPSGGMTPGERRVIEAIENKAAKPAYSVKIRLLHIAPKDKFNGGQKAALIGGFRIFGDGNINGLKPDTSKTWTGHNAVLFKSIEQPYLDYKVEGKKKRFVDAYKGRSAAIGIPGMILNIEEIATIFHFPINPSAMQSNVENISVRKGQPPSDLPML
jgi:hypothetical protein